MNCLCCGKETSNPKYCSSKCSVTINNTKRFKKRNCIGCGIELEGKTTAKYCYSCKYPDKTIKELIYNKGHKSNAYSHIRSKARLTAQKYKLDFVCSNCGYSKHVEVCHIKPISDYAEDTLVSEVNAKCNLLILCPNCHWEFDNGLLTLRNGEIESC